MKRDHIYVWDGKPYGDPISNAGLTVSCDPETGIVTVRLDGPTERLKLSPAWARWLGDALLATVNRMEQEAQDERDELEWGADPGAQDEWAAKVRTTVAHVDRLPKKAKPRARVRRHRKP